jgi:hypothetical protein
MMTWAEKRLTVNQIKTHPFFFGADWNSLRHIEPPFVPHLQSTVDTSYFPTEEFGNVAEQMEQVEGISREKDIAFLKCVLCVFLCFCITILMIFFSQLHIQAGRSLIIQHILVFFRNGMIISMELFFFSGPGLSLLAWYLPSIATLAGPV